MTDTNCCAFAQKLRKSAIVAHFLQLFYFILIAASTPELDNLDAELHELREQMLRQPLLQDALVYESVTEVLKRRLPSSCSYSLIEGHPDRILITANAASIHLLTGKGWLLHSKYPNCVEAPRSIFLRSLSPDSCASAIDFEWVECGGAVAGSSKTLKYHGQTYIFFCRESPSKLLPVKGHWIDGGSGLCSVLPTNWVPPAAYFMEVEPISLEQKAEHVLVTAVVSHHISKVRAESLLALQRRNISYHSFGSYKRTMSITQYLKSFNSKPWINASELGMDSKRIEKQNAIRWSKFHLALDHVSQNGYMSEKVWQALRAGTVPIYYGAPEAPFFLPPESTIFMNRFDSYDSLIDYLLYLDANDTAYQEYMNWRQQLHDPTQPYTRFLNSYGQGEKFSQHLCLVDVEAAHILRQLKSGAEVAPFQRQWTVWDSGIECNIPEHGCSGRRDFRDPPHLFHCTRNSNISLQPYDFP